MKPLPTGRLQSERGIALVLTLVVLVIVTIMVIAFCISMRVEQTASQNFNDLIAARQLAQGAVDQAVATIRNATPASTTASTWVAVPGAIINVSGGGVFTTNLLYTTPSPSAAGTVNLNANGLITGINSFFDSSSVITSGWQCVTNSGRMIGQIAYWVDVEATKVNVNLSGLRDPADLNQSNPTNIDLRALEQPLYSNAVNVAALVSARSAPPAQPWFTTTEEVRRGLPAPTFGGYNSNKFFMTVGTFDTNTDAFGRSRIDLTAMTNIASAAYTQAYNRFTDDAWATVLYPSAISSANRNTLQKKYGEFGARQILANIIDYQKPANTTPTGNLDADVVAAGFAAPALDADGIPKYFSGLKKSLYIDEVIVHVATNAVDAGGGMSNTIVHVFVDVKFVNGFTNSLGNGCIIKVEPSSISVDYTNALSVGPTAMPVSEISKTFSTSVGLGYGLLGSYTVATGLGVPPPPEYMSIINGGINTGAPVVTNVIVNLRRVRLFTPPGNPENIVDWMAPSDFATNYPSGMSFPSVTLQSDIVPYLTSSGTITSPKFNYGGPFATPPYNFHPLGLGKQDPHTRTFTGLTAGSLAYGTIGGISSFETNWFALGTTDVRPVDPRSFTSRLTPEVFNLLADVRFVEPGSGNQPSHIWADPIAESSIQSLGELTYIHTGYPWRSIRFRSIVPQIGAISPYRYAEPALASPYTGIGEPNTGLTRIETNAAPDWLMADFFTVGSTPQFQGRVNVNTRFLGGVPANFSPRLAPVSAVINATSTNLSIAVNPSIVDAISSNIVMRNFVSGSPYTNTPAYLTPGEICEVQDLAYFSDLMTGTPVFDNNPSKIRRQQLLRRISNIVTARSSTFTIWGIAQSIKKVYVNNSVPTDPINYGYFPDRGDFISGEVKVQAIVDRYEEGGVVKFRTRYYRFIYD